MRTIYGTTLNFKLAMEGMNRENRARNVGFVQEVEAIEGLRDVVIRRTRYKRYRQQK